MVYCLLICGSQMGPGWQTISQVPHVWYRPLYHLEMQYWLNTFKFYLSGLISLTWFSIYLNRPQWAPWVQSLSWPCHLSWSLGCLRAQDKGLRFYISSGLEFFPQNSHMKTTLFSLLSPAPHLKCPCCASCCAAAAAHEAKLPANRLARQDHLLRQMWVATRLRRYWLLV